MTKDIKIEVTYGDKKASVVVPGSSPITQFLTKARRAAAAAVDEVLEVDPPARPAKPAQRRRARKTATPSG